MSRKGSQINESNTELLTPLHVAADYGHFDVMETFIRIGARVNAVDALGQTGKILITYLHVYIKKKFCPLKMKFYSFTSMCKK